MTQRISEAAFSFVALFARFVDGGRTEAKHSCMWDVISVCSTLVYEPIKHVWVDVGLPDMIRIIIPDCVVQLDLLHFKPAKKSSVNEQPHVQAREQD